jgi:hypothetical protein
MSKCFGICVALAVFALQLGCNQGPQVVDFGAGDEERYGDGKVDTSAVAVFLDFEFDANLVTRSCFNPRSAINEQLLYTVGQLNGQKSVGRLDQLKITQVQSEESDDGCEISYHAVLPVAWGKRNEVPEDYTLMLPLDVSRQGTQAFMDKYEHRCLSWGAHDVTAGIFWYYYRPELFNCHLDSADIVRGEARVSPSVIQTTGKYPEYHKIWEDEIFEVVAIFGKVEDGGGNADGGVRGYNSFISAIKELLRDADYTSQPADIPSRPGNAIPEIRFEGSFDDGRKVRVSAFLIDSVGNAGFGFWNKYEELTPTADFIVYNGHSGLGANIQKLAGKGVWATGQYSVVFMNGCDTYAYVDSALADAHAAVNDDDPDGTKYLDVVANAMPSFFRSMPLATMALVEALLNRDEPKTYEEIFKDIDKSEVVLVTGEHDNVYTPGYSEEPPF